MELRIAVTAVGSGIGHAIVQSCRMMPRAPYLVGFDASPMAFDAFDCDERHVVPDTRSGDYVEVLLRRCAASGVRLLIPGLDDDVSLLAVEADRFRAHGITVLIGGPEFVRLCRDKIAWSRELHAVCPSVVPAWTPDELPALHAAGALRYPLVAKPLEGSGSVGVTIVTGPQDFASLGPRCAAQPFVLPREGDPARAAVAGAAAQGNVLQAGEISFQALYVRGGRLVAKMASRNRLKAGVPVEIVPIDDGPYFEALRPALEYLLARGLRGPVNFQGRMTDDGPRFFEMNGRFTGITALRAMLGFNEVEAAVADFLELPVPRPPQLRIHRSRVGLRQVVDRVVDADASPELRERVAQQLGSERRDGGLAVLVTGATGWLGRQLVAALLAARGVGEVTALVRDPAAARALWPASARLRIVPLDADTSLVTELAGADLVYHLAFARPGRPGAELAASVELTRRIVSAAQRVYVPRFVFASSQAVYGLSRPPPWGEDLAPAPETPYGVAKAAGEQLTAMLKEASPSSRVTSVRLAKLYGAEPGVPWAEVPHVLCARAAAGEPIVVRGGDQVFDLLHVRDAVGALLRFTRPDGARWAPAYNLGGGAPVTLLELGRLAQDAARKLAHRAASLEVVPGDGPPRRFGLDVRRFGEELRWSPRVDVATGISELVGLAAER